MVRQEGPTDPFSGIAAMPQPPAFQHTHYNDQSSNITLTEQSQLIQNAV